MNQLSFASLDYQAKKKRTKRGKFLAEMDGVIPWPRIEALIEPHYPRAGNSRRPYPLDLPRLLDRFRLCWKR